MIKKTIRSSVIVCFTCCVVGCGTYRIIYDSTQKKQRRATQDSSDKKAIQETKLKSTKVTVEAEFLKQMSH